ncbi:hypothetical protein OUZ56_009839 [Daphnia magna]|uniref:Uncharacterized protein n=1 Tax=Daphnia magna TaxID=35525 RepID=A0ABR0AH11_9CRUS|nr:hypothetical protein OUZ56_009839 [Daphnia magna]
MEELEEGALTIEGAYRNSYRGSIPIIVEGANLIPSPDDDDKEQGIVLDGLVFADGEVRDGGSKKNYVGERSEKNRAESKENEEESEGESEEENKEESEENRVESEVPIGPSLTRAYRNRTDTLIRVQTTNDVEGWQTHLANYAGLMISSRGINLYILLECKTMSCSDYANGLVRDEKTHLFIYLVETKSYQNHLEALGAYKGISYELQQAVREFMAIALATQVVLMKAKLIGIALDWCDCGLCFKSSETWDSSVVPHWVNMHESYGSNLVTVKIEIEINRLIKPIYQDRDRDRKGLNEIDIDCGDT